MVKPTLLQGSLDVINFDATQVVPEATGYAEWQRPCTVCTPLSDEGVERIRPAIRFFALDAGRIKPRDAGITHRLPSTHSK